MTIFVTIGRVCTTHVESVGTPNIPLTHRPHYISLHHSSLAGAHPKGLKANGLARIMQYPQLGRQ